MSSPKASRTAVRYSRKPSVVSCTRCFNRFARSWMNALAHSESRLPTSQEQMSLLSASRAIHVRQLERVFLDSGGSRIYS